MQSYVYPTKQEGLDSQQENARLDERINQRFVGERELTEQQREAARNVVRGSLHSEITLLPTHQIDPDGSLSGFEYSCSVEDKAAVLPMNSAMFCTTCVYECSSSTSVISENALRIFSDYGKYKAVIQALVEEIKENASRAGIEARFDCIRDQDEEDLGFVLPGVADERVWTESLPVKMGIYHAFIRSTSKDTREHKIFLVVKGCLQQAAEELFNLWQDIGQHINCDVFINSQEVQWLRSATVRNHNRIAARLAKALDLSINPVLDTDSQNRPEMLIPSTITMACDMAISKGRLRFVNNGCLLEKTNNGVVFDMYASEGFWVFMGPNDTTTYNSFGSKFAAITPCLAFPTNTVLYNAQYPSHNHRHTVRVNLYNCENVICDNSDRPETCDVMFPNEDFYKQNEALGFDRNDGITVLMPILTFVQN